MIHWRTREGNAETFSRDERRRGHFGALLGEGPQSRTMGEPTRRGICKSPGNSPLLQKRGRLRMSWRSLSVVSGKRWPFVDTPWPSHRKAGHRVCGTAACFSRAYQEKKVYNTYKVAVTMAEPEHTKVCLT